MTNPSPALQESLVPDGLVGTSEGGKPEKGLEGLSPGQLAWRRFRKDKAGITAGCVVIFFFLIGILAPLISKLYGRDPYERYGRMEPGLLTPAGTPIGPNGGMSGDFWLGLVPGTGRDVFMALSYGIRNSLLIAFTIVAIILVTAVFVGVTAGYLGGLFDYVSGRVMDILLALPATLFYLAFIPIFESVFIGAEEETSTMVRVIALVVLLSIFGWSGIGRLLRGQVLSLREREFVEAAKVSGARPRRIVVKELLPNLWTPILVQATLYVPAMVTAEAAMSFLGVGIMEPTPSWGRMIADATRFYQTNITFLGIAGGTMVVFVLAFNLLGDSIRDALDPKTSR